MLGLGPGALPTDATMIGISLEEQRTAFEEDVDVLMAILNGEAVTAKTSRYNLVEARTQYAPYSDFDIAVAAIASPTGPRVAAKHGINLLSVGATAPEGGFDALALHWDVMTERAPQFGHTPNRDGWRLCGPMHLAETREQAIEDVRFGLDAWCDYTQNVLAAPHFRAAGKTFEERVAWVNETGLGVIGTPDDAVAQVERLEKQSGGFGSYLLIHHEWARHDATLKSYELFANHVKPRFQGSTSRLTAASEYARSRWAELDKRQGDAIQAATERHAKERANA
jgi:limonene 1,2-monooxygenase